MANPDRSAEQDKQDLFISRYGVRTLREVNPIELGRKPTEEVITAEGFRIRGRNETSVVRALNSLNGIPVSVLEENMGGFLVPGQSLTEVLAKDNETVLGMGMTHQQLADFLY